MTDVSSTIEEAAHDHGHEHGMSDAGYVKIAILLAVFTGVEVALSYLKLPHAVTLGGLLVLMAAKFGIVASYFMHLKFDDKLLTRIFYAGLAFAVGVYVAALTTLHVFW